MGPSNNSCLSIIAIFYWTMIMDDYGRKGGIPEVTQIISVA